MGLGIVLVFWAVIGTLFAGGGSVLLSAATGFLTRGVTTGRRKAIVFSGLFPFICLGWMAIVFVFQGLVNEALLGRDLGIGDTWHCPLPNGYQLMMIDVTDQGWIYNPKTQSPSGVVGEQEDAVAGIRTLQVTERYILGGVDRKAFEHLGKETKEVDSYVVLDTQTGKRTTLPNYEALRTAALQIGVQPNLEPINNIYSKYRFSWFDVFSGLLVLIPPIVAFGYLVRWIIQLRGTRMPIPQSA